MVNVSRERDLFTGRYFHTNSTQFINDRVNIPIDHHCKVLPDIVINMIKASKPRQVGMKVTFTICQIHVNEEKGPIKKRNIPYKSMLLLFELSKLCNRLTIQKYFPFLT